MDGYTYVERIRVTFRDMDVLGHVNNAVYLTYLETARINWWMEATGRRTAAGIPLILAEVTVTYKSPAYMGEVLLVGQRIAEVRNSSFITENRIEEESTGRLVATARVVMVHFDYEAGRPAPIPHDLRSLLSDH